MDQRLSNRPVLEVRGLTKRFGGLTAVKNLGFEVNSGEIFGLIGKGFSTRDIAQQLQLGEKTVHSHRFQIKAKLGIKHSAELYSLAARLSGEEAVRGQVGIASGSKLQQDEGADD